MIDLTDDIINEADKNNLVAMILLDLSAAFDCIDHKLVTWTDSVQCTDRDFSCGVCSKLTIV